MKPSDKSILESLYIAHLVRQKPDDILKQRHVDGSNIQSLVDSGLIDAQHKLTPKGTQSLKIVLAGGVFDIIHPGHIHTLNAAKRLGDILVVVIATDETAIKMKKRTPLHSQEQRRLLVDALYMVDAVVIGCEGDIFKTVDMIRPQVIALGYDQIHQEKTITDGCLRINLPVTVARLESPIPEVSSSTIQSQYGDKIHGT